MKEYVPIFFDWVEVTGELNAQEKGRLIDAIVLYAQGGDWQEQIKGNERYLFPAFRKQIDRSREISELRSEAGSKPKQTETKRNKTEQTQTKPSKPEQTGTNGANANEEEYNYNKEEYKEDNSKQQEHARAREEDHSYRHTPIGDLVSANLSCMTGKAWEDLRAFLSEMPEDLVKWAILDSCDHGGNNWAYVRRVLCALQEAGIRTVEEAEKRSEAYRQQRQRSRAPVAQLNYEQREYEERKPGELPAWLKDEIELEGHAG